MAEPILLERNLFGHVKLWAKTLRLNRRSMDSSVEPSRRMRVRVRSLSPIKRPVFIIGCPRSGTTYLGTVLEAIPEATYFFEPAAFKYYVRLMKSGRMSPRLSRLVYSLGFHALMLAAPGSGNRIIEKNPNHVFAVEELAAIFPDAKFVIITRDGRDVALSLAAKAWHSEKSKGGTAREPGGYLYGPDPHFYIEPDRNQEYIETSDLHRCIWIWKQHQQEVERIRDSFPAEAQFHLRYEALVEDPEHTLRPLLDFLGASQAAYEPVLAATAAGRSTSVGRWRKELEEDQLLELSREAGELLDYLDYA